jgi:single-strand DNA-binding protein
MANINVAVLVGRTTRDVELKYTSTGSAVGKFSLAVNRWNGTEEVADFFDCTVWGKQAETMSQYVPKGMQIVVIGELRQNRWTTEGGAKRSRVYVNVRSFNFADGKRDDAGLATDPNPGGSSDMPPPTEEKQDNPFLSELDDEDSPF